MGWFFFVMGIIAFILGLIATIATMAEAGKSDEETAMGAISIPIGVMVAGAAAALLSGIAIWG
jgi:hypothetical protein